jgi:G:T/U-mismatch repair DNA glycosylase
MSSRHLIEQFDFNIAFDRVDAAMQSDAYLSELLTGTLLPIIDEVLNAYDIPGTVLSLAELELDLGALARADYAYQVGPRLRAVLSDALARALPDAAARSGSADPPLVAMQSRYDAELDQLALFLASGRLPWHADIAHGQAHVVALDRLLEHAGDPLWTLLAEALRQPDSARRLIEQYPERQLLAILERSAAGHAAALRAVLDAVLARLPHDAERALVHLCWQRVLEAGLARSSTASTVQTLGARILAELGGAPRQGNLARLERFLGTGQWPAAAVPGPGPGHVHALDQLLELGGGALWSVVDGALGHPDSARRLVEQFPERQLLAILQRRAPQQAVGLCRLLDALREHVRSGRLAEAVRERSLSWCWQKVLAASAAPPDAAISPTLLCASILGELATLADAVPDELAELAQLLGTGQPSWNGRTQVEALDRLLEHQSDSVRPVLAAALARPDSVRRLARHYPERQLLAILSLCAPGRADGLRKLITTLRQHARAHQFGNVGEQQLMQFCWQQVLAASQSAALATEALGARIVAELAALYRRGANAEPDGQWPANSEQGSTSAPGQPDA